MRESFLLIVFFFLSALIIVVFALKPETTASSLATLVDSLTTVLTLIATIKRRDGTP